MQHHVHKFQRFPYSFQTEPMQLICASTNVLCQSGCILHKFIFKFFKSFNAFFFKRFSVNYRRTPSFVCILVIILKYLSQSGILFSFKLTIILRFHRDCFHPSDAFSYCFQRPLLRRPLNRFLFPALHLHNWKSRCLHLQIHLVFPPYAPCH